MAAGRGTGRRWALTAALVVVLVSLPVIIRSWPTADSDRTAADLRSAALASASVAFTGYAVSSGGLSLPVGNQLSSVADLLSDRASLRVWWRGPDDSRVDVVTFGGETDYHRDATGTWVWNYEANTATRTTVAPLSVPTLPDLVPSTLARRLLSEATPAEISRIGAERVAGRAALGVRITPADAAASIAAVDVWIDPASGLPLAVQVFGKGGVTPDLETRFLDLDLGRPDAAVTGFAPPATAQFRSNPQGDVLQNAGRRLATVTLPDTLAGLQRRTVDGAPASVGLYGRGITVLAVVPLGFGVSRDLEQVAAQDPSAVRDELGVRLAAGPLSILLADETNSTPYLLTGTVTLDALAKAAHELPGLAG